MSNTSESRGWTGWLAARIPAVSALELGVFRLFVGAGLALTINDLRLPDAPFPRDLHLTVHPLARAEWVHRLAERTDLVSRIETAAIALAIIFAMGLLTRAALVALVALLTAWTLVRLTHTGAHAWSPVLVTLGAWLPVAWGDAFGLDALVRRFRGRPRLDDPRTVAYGYALWIPGLVFGAAMLAAAVAKLHNGIAWITNGTVKYFFVIDAARAPSDWGLWVASHHWAAVALSAGAVVAESSPIVAVLFPGMLARLPFALMGLALLGGFWAFQHELWYGWWLLFLAFFVPWPSLVRVVARQRSAARESAPRLTRWQVVAIAAVAGLQLTASAMRVEISPLLSDYPMYSTTFGSIEEFERRNAIPPVYHFTVRFADGTAQYATHVFEALSIDDIVRDVHLRLAEGRGRPDEARMLNAAAARLRDHYGEPVVAIAISVDQRAFDFETGRFRWRQVRAPVREFPVPLELP